MVYILLEVIDFGCRSANAKKGNLNALIHVDKNAQCLLNCKWI